MADTIIREGTKFSLIPAFLEHRRSVRWNEYGRFVSGITNLALLGGALISMVVLAVAPPVVHAVAPGLEPATAREAVALLRVCSPIAPLAGGAAILSVFLNAERSFTPVALRGVITPAVVASAVIATWWNAKATYFLASAYDVGFATYFLVILWSARRLSYRHRWRALPSRTQLRRVILDSGFPALGFTMTQSIRAAERMFASLTGPGGVAAYYYAYRVFSAGQTIIGLSIATTRLPAMAETHAAGGDKSIIPQVRRGVARALAISLPIAAIVLGFHQEIVRLLYARGAFGTASVALSSRLFAWLSLGLPVLCLLPILSAGLYAQSRFRAIFGNMCLLGVVGVLVDWIFTRLVGLEGIAIGLVIASSLAVGHLLWLLSRRSQGSRTMLQHARAGE